MIIRIVVIAFATYLTRVIPFIFLKNKSLPDEVTQIIELLPYATISLLVVYSYKDVNLSNGPATLIASLVCMASYLWKKNSIISIFTSTLVYMLLI